MRRSTMALAVAAAGSAVWFAQTGRAGENGAASDSARAESPLAALGRRLFLDPAASRDGKRSCASCHDPEHGWSDAKALSEDAGGPTLRHSQTVEDVAGAGFHWDGEFATPRDLVVARIGDRSEALLAAMTRDSERREREKAGGKPESFGGSYGGLTSGADRSAVALSIPERLSLDARYSGAFQAAFGDAAVTSQRVVDAVDAFVLSLRTGRNALDGYLAGDSAALAADSQRGLELFRGRAACATCHVLDVGADGRAALSDRRFHDTGIAFATQPAAGRDRKRAMHFVKKDGKFVREEDGPDLGRGVQTAADADAGAFKTPSLRDVARRGPYMHDGSLKTLEDVVRYYSKGGTPNAHLDPAIKKLDLSDAEVADLVAFLGSLSGEKRAGLLPARTETKRVRVTVVDPSGAPVAGLALEVVPSGERLDDAAQPQPVRVTTTSAGVAEFDFPQTTHVQLRSDAVQIGYGRDLPDCTADVELTAAARDKIVVRLRGKDLPAKLAGTVATGIFSRLTVGSDDDTVRVFDLASSRPELKEKQSSETFAFERLRAVSADESVYVAPVGAAKGPAFVRFKLDDGRDLAAAIDLSGGASEPTKLRSVVVQKVGVGVK